jgi:DNA helicase-2/ATP-dependent DNA helicase PcrA
MSKSRAEFSRSDSVSTGAEAGPNAPPGGSGAPPSRGGYLASLNARQREAVETLDGPVLVLAGAGVGKTRVLTTRIAHLMATGRARGHEILAVTFTNKAASEMRTRLETLTGFREITPWMGTFHAIGAKLLRRHAELVGLKPNFTILDTDDQLRLLKQVMKDADIDEKRWPARAIAAEIDGWKNRGLAPADAPRSEASGLANGKGAALYLDYQTRLKALNAVDFGDLLLETLRLLRDNAELVELYQRRFRYILVDEYQDTNHVQYLWLRLLASGHRNICCVGDDDQAIYGWRGADVDNILRFERDFPGAKIIRLECNYRSTGHILGAASGLIANNRSRLGKTLYTDAEEGEKPAVVGVWDSSEEARDVGEEIEAAQREGVSLTDMAVLVRASFQMREFEERFIEMGLPYRIIGGPRFYERAEVRDALAYIRCAAQPDDDLAFERIYNTPKRGLGETTLALLARHARERRQPLMQAARELVEGSALKPKARQALKGLVDDFGRWRSLIDTLAPEQFAQMVVDESGLVAMWEAERTEEGKGRLENLKEFVRSIGGFSSLAEFLEHVSLVVEVEGAEQGPKVSVMTLHSAKGLEFDVVFLPGWEEGLFPHPRSLEENGLKGLEEERRLAYVGVTRARRRVRIYHAANRRVRGFWQSSIASRFVEELPADHVEMRDSDTRMHWIPSAPTSRESRFDRTPIRLPDRTEGARPTVTLRHVAPASPGGARKSSLDAKPGTRVFHLKFGTGTVLAQDNGHLTIDFDHAGRKTVLESYVERVGI